MRFTPSAALSARVQSIDIVESDGGSSFVLPSTSAVLGLQFGGKVRSEERTLSSAGITGLQRFARTYSYIGKTRSILVRFTPDGATCLGIPANEISDESVDLGDLLPRSIVSDISERLHEATGDAERIAIVEQFLRSLPFERDALVARALTLLANAHDAPSVASVAEQLSMSERQLERRFIAQVGISPKKYARLRRFENAVALSRSATTLAGVANAAGYYDQSHFIRDFHAFTGMAPSGALWKTR